MGDDKLGKSGWGVGMMHRPCLTYPGQHQCGLNVLFLVFDMYNYVYVYCFQNLYVV